MRSEISLFQHWQAIPLLQEEVPLDGAYALIRTNARASFADLWKTRKQYDEEQKNPPLQEMERAGVCLLQYRTTSDREVKGVSLKDVKNRPSAAQTEYCSGSALREALLQSGQMEELQKHILRVNRHGWKYGQGIKYSFSKMQSDASDMVALEHVLLELDAYAAEYRDQYRALLEHVDGNVSRYSVDWNAKPGLFVAIDNLRVFHRRKNSSPSQEDGTRWHVDGGGLSGVQIIFKPHNSSKGVRNGFVSPFASQD